MLLRASSATRCSRTDSDGYDGSRTRVFPALATLGVVAEGVSG